MVLFGFYYLFYFKAKNNRIVIRSFKVNKATTRID